jgi:hypothetical protein
MFVGILTRLPLRPLPVFFGGFSRHQKAPKMKIKKTVHHGKIRWRVNDPHSTGGKRQRKIFETKETAERFARQTITDRQAYGIHCRW